MHSAVIIIFFFLCSCGNSLPRLGHVSTSGAPQIERSQTEIPAKLIVINVGQGSAALLQSEGESVLIDAGPAIIGSRAVLETLRRENITRLTHVIITHYHLDHFGGLAGILRGEDGVAGTPDDIIVEGCIYDRGTEQAPEGSLAYQLYLVTAGNKRCQLYPGNELSIGEIHMETVATNAVASHGRSLRNDPWDENAASIALVASVHGARIFLGGDITGGGGNPPYTTIDVESMIAPLVGDVDVLVVSHHGSKTSSNAVFLSALRPEIALISTGADNDYGHPHRDVLQRLRAIGARVLLTETGHVDPAEHGVEIANAAIVLSIDARGEIDINL